MKYQINALSVRRNTKWSIEVPVIAYAKIGLPEIEATVEGVMLAYRRTDGRFLAFAPSKKDVDVGIQWDCESEWSQQLAADLYQVYLTMGGDKPSERDAA
ncbi:hypothetical protein [Bradyrhizobium sp. LB11.1]|uniref:hypothetical protein n=1 Tax=Bradyrhizobium sp. LB11.1 TaxID=3156326 RepID=UPI00339156CB